jgi:hypothetical protein
MRQHLLLHTYNPSDKSLSGAHNEYRIIVTLARTDHREIVYSIVAVKTNYFSKIFVQNQSKKKFYRICNVTKCGSIPAHPPFLNRQQ